MAAFHQQRHQVFRIPRCRGFKRGETAFQAGGSATAGSASASAANNYKNGVMVLTFDGGGLMLEGVIGGQTFSFEPVE